MVAVRASEEDAQCFILRRRDDISTESVLALEEVIEAASGTPSPGEMIEKLSRL
jgi:hypothetical protein